MNMAKEKKNKVIKPRADKYDSKLAVNGSFEEVIKASFLGKPPVKESTDKSHK